MGCIVSPGTDKSEYFSDLQILCLISFDIAEYKLHVGIGSIGLCGRRENTSPMKLNVRSPHLLLYKDFHSKNYQTLLVFGVYTV